MTGGNVKTTFSPIFFEYSGLQNDTELKIMQLFNLKMLRSLSIFPRIKQLSNIKPASK